MKTLARIIVRFAQIFIKEEPEWPEADSPRIVTRPRGFGMAPMRYIEWPDGTLQPIVPPLSAARQAEHYTAIAENFRGVEDALDDAS